MTQKKGDSPEEVLSPETPQQPDDGLVTQPVGNVNVDKLMSMFSAAANASGNATNLEATPGLAADNAPGNPEQSPAWTPFDSSPAPKEVVPAPAQTQVNTHDVDKEYARLWKDFDAMLPYMDDQQKLCFMNDMVAFSGRTKDDNLSKQEVADTYCQISRILESKGTQPTTPADRLKIAESTLHHAAHPHDIDQGGHNTCNVNTVESRMFTRDPASATKLIADVATRGRFVTNDGTTIQIDPASLKPDSESLKQWPISDDDGHLRDGQRTYASQIFQVAAVNIYWQRQTAGPPIKNDQYTTGSKGDWTYTQDMPPSVNGHTGEHLRFKGNSISEDPELSIDCLGDIYNQISTGDTRGCFCLSGCETGDGVQFLEARNQADFKNKLLDMKKNGLLPAIVAVNAIYEPFFSDSGAGIAGGSGGWHVVTVTDFNERTDEVSMINQWGAKTHHVIPYGDLYQATRSPREQKDRDILAAEVQDEDKGYKVQGWKDLEVMRLNWQEGAEGISPDKVPDILESLIQFRQESEQRWERERKAGTGKYGLSPFDPEERRKTIDEYNKFELRMWLDLKHQNLTDAEVTNLMKKFKNWPQ